MDEEKYVDWAERSGLENLKAHVAAVDTLAKEATGTLMLLLAGVGGALAYAQRVVDGMAAAQPSAWGAAAVCIWLALWAWALVRCCMMTGPMPQVYNEPLNLYKPTLALTLVQVKVHELENIQSGIRLAVERNQSTGLWLNRVRLAMAATPVVFIVAVVAARF